MRLICFLVSFLISFQCSYGNLLYISTQGEWNSYMGMVSSIIPAGDIVTIETGTDIDVSGLLENQGEMNNYGTVTLTVPMQFINSGIINNYGTIVLTVQMQSINNGIINNAGVFSLTVLGSPGFFNSNTINNTGLIFTTNSNPLLNVGTLNTCSEISRVSSVGTVNIAPNAPDLVGVICNDGNPETQGEVILSQDPECICGTPPVPTFSQWGLIILGLCLSIIGFVTVGKRILSTS